MALQTKTITANGSKGHHRFTLKVNEDSTNIETNKSQGTYQFQISPIQTGWNWADWGSRISYSGSIGGTTFSGTIPRYDDQVTETLKSGNFEIEHNTDGNKTIPISFSVTDNTGVNYTCGNANASGEMTLTYIPRKTNFTQTNYSANIGDVSKFATVKPASPTFTHSLKLNIGDTFTKYINGNTGEWSDTEIKFPTIFKEGTNEMDLYFDAKTDLYSLFTETGVTGTIELTTYNGDNNLGVSTAGLVIIASNCEPHVTSATIYDNNSSTFALTSDHERMVAGQSLCQLSLTFKPSADEDTNTTISSLKINDVEYPDAIGTTAFSADIGTLSTNMIKVDLVNSRGLPNTAMIQVNKWVPYVAIDGLAQFTRGSQSTKHNTAITNVFCSFSSAYYNGFFANDETKPNQFSFTWRYKKETETDDKYSSWYNLDLTNTKIEENVISTTGSPSYPVLKDNDGNVVDFEYHTPYIIEYKLSDLLTSQTHRAKLSSASPIYSWNEFNFNVTNSFSFGGVTRTGDYNQYNAPVVINKEDSMTSGVVTKTIAKGLLNSNAFFNDNDYTNYSSVSGRLYLNATTLATKQNNEWIEPTCWADIIYPVGSIYMNVNNTNPSLLFGGTWEQIQGKFLVGVDSSDTDFNASEKTGGTKNHSHIYGVQYNGFYGTLYTEDKRLIRLYNGETDKFVESYNTQKSSSEAGNNGAQESRGSTFNPAIYETKTPTTKTSNLPPYMTVYMWQRTA